MIIKNNRFAAKFIMVISVFGLFFIASLFFILNKVYTPIAFGYFILTIFCILCFGFLGYILYILLDNKYYKVEETKIVLYKKDIPIKEFMFEEMQHISYTKIWYIFLFEIEAGHLFFYYNQKPYDISMSYKQALQFQKISKLIIYKLK